MNFECRLSQCIRLTRADGEPVDSWLVLGEVVAVHIDESLLENGVYQTAKAADSPRRWAERLLHYR